MYFVVLALIVAIASKWPKEFCFVLAIGYLTSGPLMRLWAIAFPSRKDTGGFAHAS